MCNAREPTATERVTQAYIAAVMSQKAKVIPWHQIEVTVRAIDLDVVLKKLTPEFPHIIWKHVDGPYVIFADGSLRWLTNGERFKLFLGLMKEADLQPRFPF